MTSLPRDTTDLYLAPVALAVDARIDHLSRLTPRELAVEVALESDTPDWTRSDRQTALLRTLRHLIDTRGWAFDWDPRGLRLTHREHTLVLGIPLTFTNYMDDTST